MGEVMNDLPQALQDIELLLERLGQSLAEIIFLGALRSRDLQKRFHYQYFIRSAQLPQRPWFVFCAALR
jgi:hypothetical protein